MAGAPRPVPEVPLAGSHAQPAAQSSHVGAGAAETIPQQHVNPLAHYYYAAAGAAVAAPLLPFLPEPAERRTPPQLHPWGNR
jgi:hypothetical protein